VSCPPNKSAASRVTSQLTPECQALGRRIKELRVQAAITQEELADRAGLFRTYLSRIERGSANPTLSMLHALSAAFGIPVIELFAQPGKEIPRRVKPKSPQLSRGRVTR
jgi:transcriptional regulator with XRE-family HTH domain